ncbi:MAG: ABC transporter substrate-binding protein, partial [Rhizobiales bacterium]|nr:ABC transporter substrate-binding protein [Hyphomicrobiales bacterium]
MLALSVMALSPLCAQPVQAQDTLSVMSFGGAYQDAQRKAVFETYTASTGIKIDEQEYGGEIAKIKAMIQSGNTTVDAVDVDAPTLLQGCDEGIFEKIDWAKIGPEDDWIKGTTSDCGVGTIVYATILAYDGAKLKDGPKTIKDLFDTKKFPGKRGLWKNPATNLEFALLADGVAPNNVYETLSTPEGVDRAFAKLDTIKDSIVWWEAGAQPPQYLASGDVVMSSAYNGRIAAVQKESNLKIVWNGGIYDFDAWAIPKGAKKKDESLKFIAFSVQPEQQKTYSENIAYGPVNKNAVPLL